MPKCKVLIVLKDWFYYNLIRMASKQPFKLINVQAMAKKLWLNANYFAKYYLFFQKKHMLVIGD